jgi:hypothetical protein
MKFSTIEILIVFVAGLLIAGCTDNTRARSFGGTSELTVPADKKLVNITWKGEDNSLWILLRDRKTNEVPETFIFQEKSRLGLMEGKVIIKEQ